MPGPVTFLPGTSPLRLGGRPYRGNFQVSVARRSTPGREQRRARGVPLRRRPVGGAQGLVAGGAQGAGGRGTLVRARRPQDGILVRPLPGHAEPGVSGDRARGTVDDRGRAGHRRRGRPVRGPPGRRRTSSPASGGRTASAPRSGRARSRPRTSCRSRIPTTRSRLTTAGGRSSSLPPGSGRVMQRPREAGGAPHGHGAFGAGRERDRGRRAGRVDRHGLRPPARAEASLDLVQDRRALARPARSSGHVREEHLSERPREEPALGAARSAPGRGHVAAGRAGHTRRGRGGDDYGKASGSDRLPAHERQPSQHDRARRGRAARTLPRNARRGKTSRVRASRVARGERRRCSASTEAAGGPSPARRSTRAAASRAR